MSEIAVLFRSSFHSFDLEIELGKHGIPFRKFGGIKFAESAHVKDALAFLRVALNPADTLSWFRTLKLIDHIGDATVEQIIDYLGVERKEFRATKTKEASLNPVPECLLALNGRHRVRPVSPFFVPFRGETYLRFQRTPSFVSSRIMPRLARSSRISSARAKSRRRRASCLSSIKD